MGEKIPQIPEPGPELGGATMGAEWASHLRSIHDGAERLPDDTCRRFIQWVVGQPELVDRYLQVSGHLPVTILTGRILGGTLGDLTEADPVVMDMTEYQKLEIHADNLAIGLADRRAEDTTFDHRVALLLAQNNAMRAMLAGNRQADLELLASCPDDRFVSVFKQSLAYDEHLELALAYLAAHPDDNLSALEYSYKAQLVANIRAVAAMLDATSHHITAGLTRDGLDRRYAAVNQQLNAPTASVDELFKRGADTILVVPTLAYYLGAVAERQLDRAAVHDVVSDGRLGEALDAAALMVRLLNDCGTSIIEDDGRLQGALIAELQYATTHSGRPASIADALLQAQTSFGAVLTRFDKDIRFGEFNVGLDGIRNAQANSESIRALQYRLQAASTAYRQARSRLEGLLESMQLEAFTGVIMRFVEFHRNVYKYRFEDPSGDYAVRANTNT